MSHSDSARDAIRVDDMGTTFSRPPKKVDRSRKGEPVPPIAQVVDEPATAEEEENER